MPRALVVADDLTGAMDTAHAFAARGYRTTVQVDPGRAPPDSTVLAVNTDSRYADSKTAAERVRRAVEAIDAPVVYKKIDSTLRGNVVSEVRSALDCGFEYGLFAPASPAVGRLTAGGYHLIEGRLLSDTEYADDPNGPASAHLPTLVEVERASHLGIETVAAGSESIRAATVDAPSDTLFTCDAVHERHLETIARAGADHAAGRRPLYAGSAGLARHVEIRGEPDGKLCRIAGHGGALGIVGSVSERSLEQLAALPEEWLIALDPKGLLSDPDSEGGEAGRRAAERLANGEHVVVTAAPDREAVDRTLAVGRAAGLEEGAIRERVASALATAARMGFDADPAGLFVTGGDVAMAVFDALDARTLSLSGTAVESGIPVGRIDGGVADGTPVVSKAGGFGGRETAVNCLQHLSGDYE